MAHRIESPVPAQVRLARRERPEILFSDAGAPLYLYNGVNTRSAALPPAVEDGGDRQHKGHKGFGHAFSLVQPIRAN